MKSLAISIVEYNTSGLVKNCLESILDERWKNNVSVWVLDNASKDDSVSLIKSKFPQVHLIENKKNVGFAAGHNMILKKAKTDYYLVLNSDTLVGKGVIDGMIEFMEDQPDCGIVSCKVLGFDGKLQPNGGDLPFSLSLLSWLFNLESFGLKNPSFHRSDLEYYESAHEVGWVSGNFMIIKKALLDKIGYLNGDYFMYFEDVEFCYRAKKSGFSVMINPKFTIKHLSGGSLNDPKFRQWSGEMIGLIKFYRQQFGQFPAFCIKLLVYFTILLRIIAFAIVGNLSYSKTYAKIIFNI